MQYKIKIVDGKDEEIFFNIKDVWNQLVDRLDNPRFVHRWEWYKCYVDNLLQQSEDLSFYCLYDSSGLQGIFPLRYATKSFFSIKLKVLELPIHSHGVLCDCICSSPSNAGEMLSVLIHHLKSKHHVKYDVISFQHVLKDSNIIKYFSGSSLRGGRLSLAGYCDYFTLQPIDQFLKSFSSKFRRNLRWSKNRLDKMGQVEIVSTREFDNLNYFFDALLAIEASGYKGKSGTGTAIMLHSDILQFYKCLIKYFSKREKVEINLLTCDGEGVAAQFGLIERDTYYWLKTAYNEKYSICSPGNILFEYLLKKCAESDSTMYINLITHGYFNKWHPQTIPLYNVKIFNNTIFGIIVSFLFKMKEFLRILKKLIKK